MKTISELNGRWWYRLIKVFYILLLTVFFISIPVIVFVEHSPKLDNEKSYIICANNKRYRLSENGIFLYNEYMWTSDKETAKSLCFDGTIDFVENRFGQTVPQITTETENSGKYELVSFYTPRDWAGTIGYSLIGIIGTFFFFELFRRIFYYIVLGTLRPKRSR